MSGKTLLASLLASCGLNAAASAQAGTVASGKPDLSADDLAAGTASLEKLVEAAHAEGKMEGSKEGRTAERARFGAVLLSEEAEGRLGLAITLLSTTDLAAEEIGTSLKSALKATVAATPAPGAAPTPQKGAGDPLRSAGDEIADDTALVDPGRAPPAGDAGDEKAIASLWGGALAAVNPQGITDDPVWGNIGQRSN